LGSNTKPVPTVSTPEDIRTAGYVCERRVVRLQTEFRSKISADAITLTDAAAAAAQLTNVDTLV
jgi:hypothetical protein